MGGCAITANEDAVKHAAMTIGYAPPQADCGWIGEAGPGPSYGDELDDGRRAGFENSNILGLLGAIGLGRLGRRRRRRHRPGRPTARPAPSSTT